MVTLSQPTSPSWVARAVARPATILLDHAHCEKKAASTAVGFLFRYPEQARLCVVMSKLAREELVHFERVLAELARRGLPFERQRPSAYGGELYKLLRTHQPARLVDELLVSALIEARSRERFTLLAQSLQAVDPPLAALYDELGPSEERHAALYLELACQVAGAGGTGEPEQQIEVAVERRLAELAEREAAIVAAAIRAEDDVRLHAG